MRRLMTFAPVTIRVVFGGDSPSGAMHDSTTRRAVPIADQRAPSHSGAENNLAIATVVDQPELSLVPYQRACSRKTLESAGIVGEP
jgi:hypothetical protein